MPNYRFYLIGTDGRIVAPPYNIEAPDDPAALSEAKKLVDGHDVEIWEGPRKVGYVAQGRRE
jgi:hypothetical protein